MYFAIDVTHLRAQMMPMKFEQRVPDHPAQPEKQRLRRLLEVLGTASGGGDERLLHHVGRVNPPAEARVQPESNHTQEAFLMPRE
jgi:hypothetical protein